MSSPELSQIKLITVGLQKTNLSASAAVATGNGILAGIFVSSASDSPTIAVYDNTAGSGALIVNTFIPIAGTWYPLPFPFSAGLYVDIANTVDCTVSYSV